MTLAGLQIKIDKTAYYGFAVLTLIPIIFIVGSILISRAPQLTGVSAFSVLLLGLCFALYHEFAQLVHQLGHVIAAWMTGYPMSGIRYEYAFTYSEYPPDEPPLPDRTHIQRSLGGVVGIALLFVIVLVIRAQPGMAENWFTHWLLNFILVDTALLLFASAVLSDGVLFLVNKDWKKTA